MWQSAVQRAEQRERGDGDGDNRYSFRGGGDFILDTAETPSSLWGSGDPVLWAEGEALTLAGGQGVGKSCLAEQLALGRAGFPEYSELLGMPIVPGRRVLYLAMDRPRQIARSFRRMVGDAWRDELNDRLRVWQGPPPYDLAKWPTMLLRLCRDADADTVILDSLKDAAIGLTDDAVGAGYNRARQTAIADGIQVVEVHHNRKALSGAKAERPTIDDLYGSTWLPSGAGSVLLITGAPGDPIVGLHHVKQPAAEFGPVKIIHDHDTGRSSIWHSTDLIALAQQNGGLSAIDAARAMFDTDKPSLSEKEKARRRLESLQKSGALVVLQHGNVTSKTATTWGPK
jgi:hypothetical protein